MPISSNECSVPQMEALLLLDLQELLLIVILVRVTVIFVPAGVEVHERE
jgi:hypothetical protein